MPTSLQLWRWYRLKRHWKVISQSEFERRRLCNTARRVVFVYRYINRFAQSFFLRCSLSRYSDAVPAKTFTTWSTDPNP